MSWFDANAVGRLIAPVVFGLSLFALSACTVEPLANARSDSNLATGTIGDKLYAQVGVDPVDTRVNQQVRNALLFSMHGGTPPVAPNVFVNLAGFSSNQTLAVRGSSLAPTAAQLVYRGTWRLRRASGEQIAFGQVVSIAQYDRTSQSFANARAVRDAENRAARDAAIQIRSALAGKLAAL